MSDCIFCKIVAGDIPCSKVFENDHIIAFLDINPSNPGHTLVVPKEHHEDLLSTPNEILNDIMKHVKVISGAAMKAVKADGFNTIVNTKPAAGQVIFHTHFHIIPRFDNDGLKHWPAKKLPEEEMQKIQTAIKELL